MLGWGFIKGIKLFSFSSFRVDPDFEIYHISYLWYTLVGALVTIVVALVVSFLTKANKPKDMNPMLLAPFVRRMIWGKDVNTLQDVADAKAKKFLEAPNCIELS